MEVSVSTTPREPSYVDTTLTTMFAGAGTEQLNVRCVVSGHEVSYLDSWKEKVLLEPLSLKRLRQLERRGAKRKIFHNTLRCIVGADFSKDLLYCQDDVEFCADWARKLELMLREASKYLKRNSNSAPTRFVLALYASYAFKAKPVSNYPTQKFYGNQCLYFPKSVLADVAEGMQLSFRLGHCPPDDIWLKEWCISKDMPILCGIPNLVQHVGTGSTVDSRFHTSPTYKP